MKYTRTNMIKVIALDFEAAADRAEAEEVENHEKRYGDPVALRRKAGESLNAYIEAFDHMRISELSQLAYKLRDASDAYEKASRPFHSQAGNRHRAMALRAVELAELLELSSDEHVSSAELENLGAYAVLKARI